RTAATRACAFWCTNSFASAARCPLSIVAPRTLSPTSLTTFVAPLATLSTVAVTPSPASLSASWNRSVARPLLCFLPMSVTSSTAYRIAFADTRLAPAPSKRNYSRSPLVNRLADAPLLAYGDALSAFDGRASCVSCFRRRRYSPCLLGSEGGRVLCRPRPPARWLDVHGI